MADETFASGLTISPLGLSCARLSVRSFVPLFIYMNGRVATEYHSVSRRLFEVTGGMILVFCLDATEWWLCVRPHCFGSLGYFDGCCHVRHPCAVYRCRQRAIGSLEGLLQFSLRTELPMAVLAGALILERDSHAFDRLRRMRHLGSDCSSSIGWARKARILLPRPKIPTRIIEVQLIRPSGLWRWRLSSHRQSEMAKPS